MKKYYELQNLFFYENHISSMQNWSDQQIREEFNYRITDGAGCIQCIHSDKNNKFKVTANGIESECQFLQIKVDENHICDLIS